MICWKNFISEFTLFFPHMAQVKATTKYVLPKPHLALCILMTVMELGMCKNPPMTQLMIQLLLYCNKNSTVFHNLNILFWILVHIHCKYLQAYYRHPIGTFAYNRQKFVKFEGKMPTIFKYSWSFVLTGKFYSLSK